MGGGERRWGMGRQGLSEGALAVVYPSGFGAFFLLHISPVKKQTQHIQYFVTLQPKGIHYGTAAAPPCREEGASSLLLPGHLGRVPSSGPDKRSTEVRKVKL